MKNSIAVLISAVLILISLSGFAQSKALEVQTIQTIEAPINEVYNILRSFERFPEWSPFLLTDPEQKNHVTGTDGQIGSAFHWEGIAEKSLGSQTLSKLEENKFLKMDCDVQKPQKSKGVFEYYLAEENGKTIVTQNFSIPCNGFQYFMMKIFGVKKEVSKINTLGLERLKVLAENKISMAN